MYACVCFSITEEEIQDEISAGANSEQELGERCGAGTSCGTCVERLGCLIEEARLRPCVEKTLAACPSVCDAAALVGAAGSHVHESSEALTGAQAVPVPA